MTYKTYTIRYYIPRVGADGKGGTVAAILNRINELPDHMGSVREAGTKIQQVRINNINPTRTEYRASFVRFRDELPRVGNRTSTVEEPPVLGPNQEVIEKNHFSLFVDESGTEIIAYQVTMEGSDISALARYLSFANLNQHTVSLDEVLSDDAWERLGSGLMKSIEFEVAKPRSKHYAPDPNDTWTKDAFEYMSKTGATRFKVKILTTSRKNGLVAQNYNDMKMLMSSNFTKALKVKMSDIDHPIDLFADRVFDKVTITLTKGWPNAGQLFDEMAASKRANIALTIYLTKRNEALE